MNLYSFGYNTVVKEYHPYRTAFVDSIALVIENCEQLHKEVTEFAGRKVPDNHETYVFANGFSITFSDCKAYIGTGVFIKEWP